MLRFKYLKNSRIQRKAFLFTLLLVLSLGIGFVGCAPTPRPAPQVVAPQATRLTVNSEALFNELVAPFRFDLEQLGISITSFEAFEYQGNNENVFFQATNDFYTNNPGYCPLENAFYASETALSFMTLASDNATTVRGFLYDQSKRPALTYAYFKGTATQSLAAIVCETVGN